MFDENALRQLTDNYVRDCFGIESSPRVSELAGRLGMTPVQFTRTFRSVVGIVPSDYLKRQQIEFAKRLLVETDLSTTQIAYRAGFGTRATFFRLFRQFERSTPRRYCEQLHG